MGTHRLLCCVVNLFLSFSKRPWIQITSGQRLLLNSTWRVSRSPSISAECLLHGWIWGTVKSGVTSHPQFFSAYSPKGGAKDHKLLENQNDKQLYGPPDTKELEFTLLSWNEPQERKEQHSAPNLDASPELGGGKSCQGVLAVVTGQPRFFLPK